MAFDLRRKAEIIPHLDVDEKSFKKGHKYATIVNDLEGSRVLYVAKDREQASLDGFWKTLTPEQLAGIEGGRSTCGMPSRIRSARTSRTRETRSCTTSSTS